MKTSKESMQVQVGAFVVIGLFLGMLVVFLLGSEKQLFETQYTLVCYFEDISGLRVGAPVQLAGINVGAVNKILFDDKLETKRVKLLLRISRRYQDRIREDSEANIVTQGLLGDKMVFVSVGSSDKKVLADGALLSAKSPAGFSQLLQKGDGLLVEFQKAAQQINDVLLEVRKGKGMAHGLIYDPEGRQIIHDVQILTSNLSEASGNLKEISAKINRGEGTLGALVNDPSLFNDLKTLLGKANRNKLIRAVIRETLRTKEEEGLKR